MSTRKRSVSKKPLPARRGPTPRGVNLHHALVASPAAQAKLNNALMLDPVRYARELIREVPDFPRPGILFRDLTPLLADPKGLALVIDALSSRFVGEHIDAIVAIEARGFIFGAALAARLNASFVPVRKPGKLPCPTNNVGYELEYGRAELEMHRDALPEGARVLVVDDLLATGGTASAAGELVRLQNAMVLAYVFVVELLSIPGREALNPTPVFSLIQYQ